MAGIKKINSTSPGVLRPVQVSDLQDIWDAIIESFASGSVNGPTPQILSGFKVNDDDTLTSGVLSYGGQLYYYDDSDASGKLSIGSSMFAGTVEDSERTLADGSVIPFYTRYKIQPISTGLSNVIPLPSGITSDMLDSWRVSFIPSKSIQSGMIADGAIGSDALASGAVTSEKISDGAVTLGKIADNSIKGSNVQDGTISMVKLRGGAFVRPFNSYLLSAKSDAIFTYTLNSDNVYLVNVGSGVLGLNLTIPEVGVTVFYVKNNQSDSVPVNVNFGSLQAVGLGNVPAGKTYKFTAHMCSQSNVAIDSVEVANLFRFG